MKNEIALQGKFETPFDSMQLGNDEMTDSLPMVKIEYMASQDAKDAKFKKGLLSIAGERQVESLDFVLLGARYMGNVMYPEKFDVDNKPLCVSDIDGYGPIGGEGMIDIPTCNDCGRSDMSWMRSHFDEKGKAEKPPCAKVNALLGYSCEDEFPFIMRVSRRARTVQFKALRTALKRKVMKAHPGAQVNWCFKIRLTVEAYDTYYVPVFTILDEMLSIDEAKQMAKIWEVAHPLFFGATMEQVMDDNTVESDAPKDQDYTDEKPAETEEERKETLDSLPF